MTAEPFVGDNKMFPRPVAEFVTEAGEPIAVYPADIYIKYHDTFDADSSTELVRGLVNAGDRVVIDGEEGAGKSTWFMQMGVQLASGIHPFTLEEIEPLRVLYISLESKADQVKDDLAWLIPLAQGRFDPARLLVITQPAGIDLTAESPNDEFVPSQEPYGPLRQGSLTHLLVNPWEYDIQRPNIVFIGPVYKCTQGNLAEESVSRGVINHFDRWSRDGIAVFVEAHQAGERFGGNRPKHPFGSTIWRRWPEFGIHLHKSGRITHWRIPRRTRDWPEELRRGGHWPWEAVLPGESSAPKLKPAARKVLDALSADAVEWLDAEALALRTGLARRTVQDSAKFLVEADLLRMRNIGNSKAQEWAAYRDRKPK